MPDERMLSKEIADMYSRHELDFLRYCVDHKINHPNIPFDDKKIKFAPFKPLPKINTEAVKKNIEKELNPMYQSPIELTVSPLVTQMEEKQGQIILKACQDVGVKVNKFELMRALEYDRQQYNKGFEDGIRAFVKLVVEKYCCDGVVTINALVEHAKSLCDERGADNG